MDFPQSLENLSERPGDAVGPEQRESIRQAFSSAAVRQPVCEPLDWLQTNEPEIWRLGSKVSHFDWYSGDTSVPL